MKLAGDTAFADILNNIGFRRSIRIAFFFCYFIVFQIINLIQKPFLNFEFQMIFYGIFSAIFLVHFFVFLNKESEENSTWNYASYFFDFTALLLFMKSFPYLSSFILIILLFILFISVFDTSASKQAVLGFYLSMGTAIVSLMTSNNNPSQNILTVALFNLSYFAVIFVSRQIRNELLDLNVKLESTTKKWRSQEQFVNTLASKLPMGLVVLDKQNQFVWENNFVTSEKLIKSESLKRMLDSSENSFTVGVNTYINNFENNKLVLDVNCETYFDEQANEELKLYLIKDVTEQKKIEKQLQQSEKMAAVGKLAAGMAHEIRNPLAGISGSIQMLIQETPQDSSQKKLMDIVIREIDRLNLLITDFLNYAKPEKTPTDTINLKQVLEDVLYIVKNQTTLNHPVAWVTQMQDLSILGYSEKLKQSFLNILINSLQAMKDSENPQIKLELLEDGNFAVVKISDNGCGMSAENLKRMFEPFHTTKAKGTGLGLAITHKILELHQAQIDVQSTVNKGTEFIIKFNKK